MCDYSLDMEASRPARIGDKLVTTSFAATFTRGFAACDEPNVAVCVLPGTELAFEHDVRWWNALLLFQRKKPSGRLVRFRKINVNKPHAHHDAIEFPCGKVVLLTLLCEGQRATVLQMPAAAGRQATPPQLEAQTEPPRAIDTVPTPP